MTLSAFGKQTAMQKKFGTVVMMLLQRPETVSTPSR